MKAVGIGVEEVMEDDGGEGASGKGSGSVEARESEERRDMPPIVQQLGDKVCRGGRLEAVGACWATRFAARDLARRSGGREACKGEDRSAFRDPGSCSGDVSEGVDYRTARPTLSLFPVPVDVDLDAGSIARLHGRICSKTRWCTPGVRNLTYKIVRISRRRRVGIRWPFMDDFGVGIPVNEAPDVARGSMVVDVDGEEIVGAPLRGTCHCQPPSAPTRPLRSVRRTRPAPAPA